MHHAAAAHTKSHAKNTLLVVFNNRNVECYSHIRKMLEVFLKKKKRKKEKKERKKEEERHDNTTVILKIHRKS